MRGGLIAAVVCVAGQAAAEPAPRLVSAMASSTSSDRHAVEQLFDMDDSTTWCAKEKVHVTVATRLSAAAPLARLHLALGDKMGWKQSPRVKQVYVSVMLGDKLQKKIRHKWPDLDARDGKITLEASGDAVVVDVDLVYGGTGSGGLCLSGMWLEAEGGQAFDAAELAASAVGTDFVERALTRKFTVTRQGPSGEVQATLDLKKRGKLVYRDESLDLKLEGKWYIETTEGGRQLVFELGKAKAGGKKLDVPKTLSPHIVPWRYGRPAPETAPTFTPWIAFERDETGALIASEPGQVTQ